MGQIYPDQPISHNILSTDLVAQFSQGTSGSFRHGSTDALLSFATIDEGLYDGIKRRGKPDDAVAAV